MKIDEDIRPIVVSVIEAKEYWSMVGKKAGEFEFTIGRRIRIHRESETHVFIDKHLTMVEEQALVRWCRSGGVK